MQNLFRPSSIRLRPMALFLVMVFVALAASLAVGALHFPRFNRCEISHNERGTRFVLKLSATPETILSRLPDKRVRLVLKGVDPGFVRPLSRYSDSLVRKVTVTRRMDDLVVTLTLSDPDTGVSLHAEEGSGVVTLDVGPAYRSVERGGTLPSRQGIREGVERLFREYDPPLESGIPFTPVEKTEIYTQLTPQDASLLKKGEAFLYKGNAVDAEQLFSSVTHDDPRVRALILTRRGESRYLLGRYRDALRDFEEAARVFPDVASLNPTAFFAQGDCLARTGDPERGRILLAGLIARNAEKPYAPMLLVRLGDILMRGGREREALALYRNVISFFPESPAAYQARMKLADRRIFAVGMDGYRSLLSEYRTIGERGGDFRVREDAAFREAILSALYGDAASAVEIVGEFLVRHPRSSYHPIAEAMQYDLVDELVTSLLEKGEDEAVVRAVESWQEYLGKALRRPDVVRGIADAYAKLSRTRERLVLFSRFVERRAGGDNEPSIHRIAIDDAVTLGDDRAAVRMATQFLERFPRDPGASTIRETLAELRYQEGNRREVIRILSPFLDRGRGVALRPPTMYYLGRSLLDEGEAKKAIAAYQRFLAANPNVAGYPLAREAAYDLARAYETVGDYRRAEATIRGVVARVPADEGERFRFRLALLQMRSGKRAEAETILKELSEKGKDPLWKRAAQQALVGEEISAGIREATRIMSRK